MEPVTSAGFESAWRIARENFGNRVFFYAPTIKRYETEEFQQSCSRCHFMPVSITGTSCELNCDHCGRQILRSMKAASTPARLFEYAEGLARRGSKGLLISGGSTRDGVVPIGPFLKTLGAEGAHKIGANEVSIGMSMPRFGVDIFGQRMSAAHFHLAFISAEFYSPAGAVVA